MFSSFLSHLEYSPAQTLYVIGNGFDRFHDLPTSYLDFKAHAKDRLSFLEEFFSFDLEDDQMWYEFENRFGSFDYHLFYDYHYLNNQAESWGAAAGVADDIQEEAERMIEALRKEFEGWIRTIDLAAVSKRLRLPHNAIYLNFNYTPVLQEIYGVLDENVLQIHGCTAEMNQLLFGHGDEIHEEPELDENGDSNRHPYSDAEFAAKGPLYAFKKQVTDLIAENQVWFHGLTKIRTVVILGHSLNDIDLPYFQKVNGKTPGAHWIVSCHTTEDETHYRSQFTKLGISSSQITYCRMRAFRRDV